MYQSKTRDVQVFYFYKEVRFRPQSQICLNGFLATSSKYVYKCPPLQMLTSKHIKFILIYIYIYMYRERERERERERYR